MAMTIKDNMQGPLKPLAVSVTSDNYYVDGKLLEDFASVKASIRNSEKFGKKMGTRGWLLVGPPGTGKTMGVQYLATELGLEFYDLSSLVKGQVQNMAGIFDALRARTENGKKKIVAFIDEIEALGNRKEIVDPLQYQSFSQFLAQMDGASSNEGIFFFGATNYAKGIDIALRRNGRFSEEIRFMPPDKTGRLKILNMYGIGKYAQGEEGHKFNLQENDLTELAKVTYGYTGADLVGILNKAFNFSLLDEKRKETNSRREVNWCDIERALKKVKPSAIRDMPFVEPKCNLEGIAGYPIHKELALRVVSGSKGSTFMLYGPKGTGKTLLPEAIAGELGYHFMVVSGNDPESKYVGETKDNLKEMIERASQLAPCVLCLDEIGALVSKNTWTGGTKEGHTGYLQSILSNPPEGIFLFATENDPQNLQGPFLDRFIYKMYFGMPTSEWQEQIWQKYLPKGLDGKELVKINSNLSCRDISQICTIVKDMGLENPSVEVFREFLDGRGTEEGDSRYEEIRKQIGDHVFDYGKIAKYLPRKNVSTEGLIEKISKGE